ncbi:hypothetical protein DXG01_012479 [Tephrocybe rancida]|nr:hypothetical protein DXG01_012479 [Tephrocybe rancida]
MPPSLVRSLCLPLPLPVPIPQTMLTCPRLRPADLQMPARDAVPDIVLDDDFSDVSLTLSIDELRWLHASESMVDAESPTTDQVERSFASDVSASNSETAGYDTSMMSAPSKINLHCFIIVPLLPRTLFPAPCRSLNTITHDSRSDTLNYLGPYPQREHHPALILQAQPHSPVTAPTHAPPHALPPPLLALHLHLLQHLHLFLLRERNAYAPAPEPKEGKHQLDPRSRALRSLHMLHEHDTHPERPHTHPREGERKLEPEHTHPNPCIALPPEPPRPHPLPKECRSKRLDPQTPQTPPLAPTLKLSTSTSSTSSAHTARNARAHPPSPLSLTRAPSNGSSASSKAYSYRPRTRSTTSRTSPSPISVHARTSPGALRPRVRPQTGFHHHHALSHANANTNANAGANNASAGKRPVQVHSVIPARGGKEKEREKEKREKEREGERSIWAMLRLGDSEKDKEKERGRDSGEEQGEGSPEQRILDIVNAAEKGKKEKDKEKGKDKDKDRPTARLKKSKGLALLGLGRPPPSPTSSRTPSSSLPTAAATSSTATILPFAQPSPSPERHRASSASSASTASSACASASTAATSPTPSLPASPKPASTSSTAPTPARGILSRSNSTASRGPLATLFGGGSAPGSVKSVTFVEEPTVHYPAEYEGGSLESTEGSWGQHEHEHEEETQSKDIEHDAHYPSSPHPSKGTFALADLNHAFSPADVATGLSRGALAWEMGLDVEGMDLDHETRLDLEVAPNVNLNAPLELEIGVGYAPTAREQIGGIIEEEEEGDEVAEMAEILTKTSGMGREGEGERGGIKKEKKKDGLKRLFSLTRGATGGKTTESKSTPAERPKSAPSPRLAISGPFALGPTTRPVSPAAAGRSSASICSQPRSRSNSSSTTHTFPLPQPRTRSPYYHPPLSSSLPSTPTHHHKAHSYSSPPPPRPPRTHRPRTAPATISGNSSPTSTTSSMGSTRDLLHPYTSSLRPAPSLESFRSAAGRSVRSLGSIKSTASVRGFRAWLGKVGIGAGPVEEEQ